MSSEKHPVRVSSPRDGEGGIDASALRAWSKLAGTEPGGSVRACAVLAVFAAACASAVGRAAQFGSASALVLAGVAALAAGAFAAVALARHVRGRLDLADAVHPLLWLLPWQFTGTSAPEILIIAGASLAALGFSTGWRLLWSALRRIARAFAARVDQPTVGLFLMLGLVWLSHLSLATRTDVPALDSSWHEVKAYELLHHWRTGVDTVFTYGPLGYFLPAPYNHELYWTQVIWWEIVFKLLLTGTIVFSARRVGGALEKTLFLASLLFLDGGQDAYFFTATVAISMLLLSEPRGSSPRTALGFLCFALLALVKFTSFVLTALCVALISLHRAWTISWRSGLRTLALYVSILLTLWTLLGQSPLDLPRYVLTSSWIAQGYNEAMGWMGIAPQVILAYTLASMLAVAALLQVMQRLRDKTVWISAAVLACGGFVAMKAALVRHNPIILCGCVAALTFLLPALEPRAGRERILRGAQALVRIACGVLGIVGMAMVFNFKAAGPAVDFFAGMLAGRLESHAQELTDLSANDARLDGYRRVIAQNYALPKIRGLVGRAPVDVFGSDQAMALFNGLNYRPRPVFQSYSAYTPELIELNARFYESERAPEFVLFEQESLDDRLPGQEDGLALQVLMRDYEPVAAEAGILLLERSSQAQRSGRDRARDPRRLLVEKTIAFGEWVDLDAIDHADAGLDAHPTPGEDEGGVETEPGERARELAPAAGSRSGCIVLALDIRPTLWGRLRSMLSKGTRIFINYQIDTGGKGTYRIVPGMMRTGVVVRPFLHTQDAWFRWYAGDRVPRISRFQVSLHAGAESLCDPRIRMRVMRDDTLLPRVDPKTAKKLRYPMFSADPEYVRSDSTPFRTRIRNLGVLQVQAPAEIAFSVEPGKHSIEARFNLIKEATVQGCSDGAGFSVVARDGQGKETVLYYRLIDRRAAAIRAPRALRVEYENPAPAQVLFRIDPGPRGDSGCDWGYWTGISITDADGHATPK